MGNITNAYKTPNQANKPSFVKAIYPDKGIVHTRKYLKDFIIEAI